MKAGAVISLLLALSGIAAGSQVRVILQVVEVPHATLTKWTGGEALAGREIHERAMTLAANGGAEIVETCVLIARSGERALAESIAELIYPTEYEPSSQPNALPSGGLAEGQFPVLRYLRPADVLSTSFETRNTGSTLEIEPMVGAGGKRVDLRINFELVDRASLITFTEFRDQWGDGSSRMPIFDTRRMTGSMTLTNGVFDLWNVFTPKPAAVPAATTRQLVFVRADVLPAGL
jgi:hypothetical protein